jgi:hypothetical protein
MTLPVKITAPCITGLTRPDVASAFVGSTFPLKVAVLNNTTFVELFPDLIGPVKTPFDQALGRYQTLKIISLSNAGDVVKLVGSIFTLADKMSDVGALYTIQTAAGSATVDDWLVNMTYEEYANAPDKIWGDMVDLNGHKMWPKPSWG